MRFPDTIAPTQRVAWRDLLTDEVRNVRSRVIVLDQNEAPLGVELPVISGTVNVDATADVTRTADLVALDLDDALGFEAGSPWAGAVFADKFVRLEYGVEDRTTKAIHWTPVFQGPVVGFERSRPEIRIAAQGKESLLLAPCLPYFRGDPVIVAKGAQVDDAVRRIASAAGEALFSLPVTTKRKTQARIDLGRNAEPWRAIRKVAKDAGMVAFYDGAGRLVMRPRSRSAVVTFDAELLTTWPTLKYDLGSDFRNTILVVGEADGKEDRRPLGWAVANQSDPLSPAALSRNGAPRFIAEYVKVDAKDRKKVQQIADDEFAARMRQAVSVEFEALTVPGLEEGDPCSVVPPGAQAYGFTADTFGFELGTDGMSVGKTRSLRVRKRRG